MVAHKKIGVKLKKKAVSKGNAIPDNKPENSYKKVAKAGIKARAAGKSEGSKR